MINTWPFTPIAEQTPDQSECWWSKCYVKPPQFDALIAKPQFRIITGAVGCGRTLLIEAFAKKEKTRSLLLPYPEYLWSGSEKALRKGGNHLSQMMAVTVRAIVDLTVKNPNIFSNVDDTGVTFLHWLLGKYLSGRAYEVFLNRTVPDIAARFRNTPARDLYPTDVETEDVQGQIDELCSLVQSLNFQQLIFLMDVPLLISQCQVDSLIDLMGWLEIMQHPTLSMIIAIPRSLMERIGLLQLSRDRVAKIEMNWNHQQVHEIASRHLIQATKGTKLLISDLACTELISAIDKFLEEEYGEPVPAAWLQMAQILLKYSETHGTPPDIKSYNIIRRSYYQSFMPLRLDPANSTQGVWRGSNFIKLDTQPYNMLLALFHPDSRPDAVLQRLSRVAGSKENINTLAHRLRDQLEPKDCGPSIYIQNERDKGYWITNTELATSVS